MVRLQNPVLIVAAVCLLGCSPENDGSALPRVTGIGNGGSEGIWRERYLELGRETYKFACASCHDKGKDAAPVIGDRESWSNRSPLWSAVLFEHAKNGYMDMPAGGGHPELTERAVEAAGEYMLSETFPELPRG